MPGGFYTRARQAGLNEDCPTALCARKFIRTPRTRSSMEQNVYCPVLEFVLLRAMNGLCGKTTKKIHPGTETNKGDRQMPFAGKL